MSESLIDNAPNDEGDDSAADGDGGAVEEKQENGWFFSDGVAGEGEAPEWFKGDKYKTVADQAAAYKDLEGKFGGFTGAPEGDYELSLPEGIEGDFIDNDPRMTAFQELAKNSNMSQDVFTEFLHTYIKGEVDNGASSVESELTQLGDNASKRLKAMNEWSQANLSEDEYNDLLSVTSTAAGVRAVEALIAKTKTKQIPTGDGEVVSDISRSELRNRMSDPRYRSDPAFRKETSEMYERKFGNQPQNRVVG